VQVDLRMCDESFFGAVNIFDRYMAETSVPVDRNSLQLMGSAAVLIASKVHDVKPPDAYGVAKLCVGQYTARQVADAEMKVLTTLRWRIQAPSPGFFIHRWSHVDALEGSRPRLCAMATYLAAEACLCYDFAVLSASVVAATAVVLAGMIVPEGEGPGEIGPHAAVEIRERYVPLLAAWIRSSCTDARFEGPRKKHPDVAPQAIEFLAGDPIILREDAKEVLLAEEIALDCNDAGCADPPASAQEDALALRQDDAAAICCL